MKTTLLLLVTALVVACAACIEKHSGPETRLAPWDEFTFRALDFPATRSCNLTLAVPPLATGAEVRLLFELQPDNMNYYFVGLTRDRLTLGKVECGVEIVLARWTESSSGAPCFAEGARVIVRRRPGRISVISGVRKVIEAADDTLTQGGVALGCLGLADDARPTVAAERTGEIFLTDDFMRGGGEAAAWQPVAGAWEVRALANPNLSANAFRYTGRGAKDKPGIALIGEPWWDDYSVEVSAKPAGPKGVGLVARWVDPANHYIFRQGGGETLQLVRVLDGHESPLAERKASLSPGQWYRLRLEAAGETLSAFVDDLPVLEVRDSGLAFGRAGLCAGDARVAEFDDFCVKASPGIVETFEAGTVRWSPKGGSWSVVHLEGARTLLGRGPEKSAPRAAKLLTGDEGSRECRLSATVEPGSAGEVGLVAGYRDESNYAEFVYDISESRYQLCVAQNGERRVVATRNAWPFESSRELAVSISGGVVICEADGERVLSAFNTAAGGGKVGLCVGPGGVGTFSRVSVAPKRHSEPIVTRVDTFSAESTMANWASAEYDWAFQNTDVWGSVRGVRWHRGAFPGGGELHVTASFDPSKKAALRLFTCCDVTTGTSGTLKSGYELAVQSPGPEEGRAKVDLIRNGVTVASRDVEALKGASRVALGTRGDCVVAELNGTPVLAFKDESPLGGWRSGYAAENLAVKRSDVEVFCENTIIEGFVQAPVRWRTAGGEWLVTNRWRCDPRWSFFGGESMEGVAAIWNKAALEGDQVLEFAAAIRHQGSANYSVHASDLNAVMCGDGADLASGYGFLFGGFGNTRTVITRNGKTVAESALRISGEIHRRWFVFRIVKRGGSIKYYLDGQLILTYDDPEPLHGGQVALWTWKNGLMVARVSISAERIGPLELFGQPRPTVSKCHYDR